MVICALTQQQSTAREAFPVNGLARDRRQEWKINHATIEPEIAGCPDKGLLSHWDSDHAH
jgi:hypothetical protein